MTGDGIRIKHCISVLPFISWRIMFQSCRFENSKLERTILIWVCACVLSLLGICCEQGLAPPDTHTTAKPHGISGILRFSHWPPADSVHDLRVAALQRYPVQDILGEVLAGRAQYTGQLPYGVDTLVYKLVLDPLPAGTFPFICVAQQYGPNIQTDWRVVGEYYTNNDTTKPGSVIVPPDSIVPNINMTVDFQHVPPQP